MGEVRDRRRLSQSYEIKYMLHLLKDNFSWGKDSRQKVYFLKEERKAETSLTIYVCDLRDAGGKKQYF